ncbi:MAG: pitrilysin family protein [Candidatus Sumerlaeia bacterium]
MQKTRLPNGLTVLMAENKAAPVVTIDVWVNTGAANEPREINGVSHFLEHMLFKGTSRYPLGQIDAVLEGVGGVVNAATSEDYTHYYVTVPAAHFTTGLDVLSDMIQNAVLDEEELERERLVILEEYRRKQDNPMASLFEDLYEKSFQSGPYSQTVLGSMETIRAITRQAMFEYYSRYYAPENMAVVIVGDVDPRRAMTEIERVFGDFSRPHRPVADHDVPTIWQRGIEQIVSRDVNESYLGMSLPAPGGGDDDDVYAMKVLVTALGTGRSSRLERRIKEEQRLCVEIDADYSRMRYPSLFVVAATFRWEDYEKLKSAITRELQAVVDHGLTSRELAKAKRVLATGFYFNQETTSGQAGTFGYYYTVTGSEQTALEFVEKVQSVTSSDVRRVAQRYIRPDEANWFVIRPRE